MTSKLEQLKPFNTVVCDTGNLEAISRLRPVGATTNPSLLLKACAIPEYAERLRAEGIRQFARDQEKLEKLLACA